jgi:hypothetical protein
MLNPWHWIQFRQNSRNFNKKNASLNATITSQKDVVQRPITLITSQPILYQRQNLSLKKLHIKVKNYSN